jgi:hypothetical protein
MELCCFAYHTEEDEFNDSQVKVKVKVKVKQSRYRPGVAQRVPGSSGSQIS